MSTANALHVHVQTHSRVHCTVHAEDRGQRTEDRYKPSMALPCVTRPPFVYAFVALIAGQVQTVSGVGEST